jgi:glycosyltransferase involved in cell wall biosynthesis
VASRRVSFPLERNPLARFKYTHRVDRIIAVSEGIRTLLERAGIPGERIRVVPSAVDLDRFRNPPSREECRRRLGTGAGEFLVGAVGHLAPHKGHRVLIDAARRLSAGSPTLRYLLVGRGELEAELQARIRSAGLEGVFRLAGFQAEVAGILAAFDLLVFPSLSGEGSPAVVKEAMACGLPVVASDISGVREVIRDGEEGLLVPPGDPAALAEAIQSLVRDPTRGVRLGRRGRERCREFAVEKMVEGSEAVYREVLAGTLPGRRPGAPPGLSP